MNLRQARVLLRGRSVTEVVDVGTLLWSQHLGMPLLRIVACGLPLYGIAAFAAVTERISPVGHVLIPLLFCVLNAVLEQLLVICAGEAMFGAVPSLRACVRQFGRRALAFSLLWMLRVFVFGLFALMVITLPIASVVTCYLYETFWLERSTIQQASTRSRTLLMRQFNDGVWLSVALVVGRLLIMAMLAMGIAAPLMLFGWTLAGVWDLVVGTRLGVYLALLGWLLSLPWAVCVRLCGYMNARTMTEGWDVQLRMLEVANAGRSAA
jgi:hypothetical protein